MLPILEQKFLTAHYKMYTGETAEERMVNAILACEYPKLIGLILYGIEDDTKALKYLYAKYELEDNYDSLSK